MSTMRLKHPRPVVLQAAALSLLLLLSLSIAGIDALLLRRIALLRERYFGESTSQCTARLNCIEPLCPPTSHSCAIPEWFKDDPGLWPSVGAAPRYAAIEGRWEPVVIANVVYAALVSGYILSYVIARYRNPDNDWTSVRSDLLLMGGLTVMGFPAAAGFMLVRWPFPDTSGIVRLQLNSDRVCEDLSGLCGPNRYSLGITWVIASLLAVVWIAELVYVVMVHGGRQAWKHGLPFLARVPVGLRKNRDAYGTGLIERYRPGTPDLAEDEDDDGMGLVPVPFKSAYVGQGDAPPVYTEGDGITPTSSRPEVVELAELRLPTESLPPFPVDLPVVESRDERWAAHKAAVLASPLSTVDEKRR